MRDRHGRLLIFQGEIKSRWREYVDDLLKERNRRRVSIGLGARGGNRVMYQGREALSKR